MGIGLGQGQDQGSGIRNELINSNEGGIEKAGERAIEPNFKGYSVTQHQRRKARRPMKAKHGIRPVKAKDGIKTNI